MKAYKGFDKDLKCFNNFQYEIGKKYVHNGNIKLCESGFHACKSPFEVLEFYSPNSNSRYCEVNASGKQDIGATKIAFQKIKINKEIGLSGLFKAGIKAYVSKVKWLKNIIKSKLSSIASSEDSFIGVKTISDFSIANVTGDNSCASSNGNCSCANTTGYYSYATTHGALSTVSGTGNYSCVLAQNHSSIAGSTGNYSCIQADDYYSCAVSTGKKSWSNTTKYKSIAGTIEACSYASALGESSCASALGYGSSAHVAGKYSCAIASGFFGKASAGADSVAVAMGIVSKAKGELGAYLVIAEYSEEPNSDYKLKTIKCTKVDGKKIKADTWYMLKNGRFVEAVNNDSNKPKKQVIIIETSTK